MMSDKIMYQFEWSKRCNVVSPSSHQLSRFSLFVFYLLQALRPGMTLKATGSPRFSTHMTHAKNLNREAYFFVQQDQRLTLTKKALPQTP